MEQHGIVNAMNDFGHNLNSRLFYRKMGFADFVINLGSHQGVYGTRKYLNNNRFKDGATLAILYCFVKIVFVVT